MVRPKPYWTAKKAYWTGKSKAFFNKQKQNGGQKFSSKFYFFIESFALNEIWELEKISLPTAAFKEDTNMFSTEFREGFGLLYLIMAIQ